MTKWSASADCPGGIGGATQGRPTTLTESAPNPDDLGLGRLRIEVRRYSLVIVARRLFLVPVLFLTLALEACGGSPTAPDFGLSGGVLATFTVSGESFRVFVTRRSTIDALFALQRNGGASAFPNGTIRRGTGAGGHNAPYTWHLDPAEIEIVDLAIEVCDGRPSYVQEHRDEYVDVIGRYCPWGARLTGLLDLR